MRTCAAVLCLLACAASAGMADTTLYVSPDGNDAWSGTLPAANAAKADGPLRSLAAARDLIRAMKAGGPLTEPVRVLLRRGVHTLEEPLILEPQDSGTEACPITYGAYQDEKPVISGGTRVEGWVKDVEGVWRAQLEAPEGTGWPLRQLFVNGERRTLARSPNTG